MNAPAMTGSHHSPWIAVLLSACFEPQFHQPICGPNGECPSGLQCASHTVCLSSLDVSESWVFAPGEFASPGYAVRDMTLEPSGSLTPNAYSYGGLVGHGLQGTKLWAHGDTSWTAIDGLASSGAGLWRGERVTPGGLLDYLGVAEDTAMTIWFEGEVWLELGSSETLQLTANDVAFVELARPGTTSYTRVVEGNATASVATPETGWYPIRIGLASSDRATASFELLHSDAGGAAIPWSRDRLRARTSELSGALRTVFGGQVLASSASEPTPISHIEDGDLLPPTAFTPLPQGTGSTDNWSARYAGQVYIAQPGPYALQITSDDGNRGRLGAVSGETSWASGAGNASAVTEVSAELDTGWNDIIVDYNQLSGGSALHVQLAGPDARSAEVPRDRLRPVEPAGDRLALGIDPTGYPIADGGGPANPATATIPVAGYPGEVVTAIDVTYEILGFTTTFEFDLETPATAAGPGTRLNLGHAIRGSGLPGFFVTTLQISRDKTPSLAALLGGPAGGAWKLHAYDTVADGNNGALVIAQITLHTTGGPERVARSAAWTSPVRTLPGSVDLVTGATWDARLPDGAGIELQIRTCQRPDCSDGAWISAAAQQAPILISGGRYLQLRVTLTSDGVREPELHALAIHYLRAPG
jgi:hypothetical protein